MVVFVEHFFYSCWHYDLCLYSWIFKSATQGRRCHALEEMSFIAVGNQRNFCQKIVWNSSINTGRGTLYLWWIVLLVIVFVVGCGPASSAPTMYWFIWHQQVMGMYFVSSILLLRMNLPVTYRSLNLLSRPVPTLRLAMSALPLSMAMSFYWPVQSINNRSSRRYTVQLLPPLVWFHFYSKCPIDNFLLLRV